MPDRANARQHMIDGQLRPNEVNDQRIIDAVAAINREKFVPKAFSGVAYLDEDLPIGGGRYLMEPMVFARLLHAAAITPHDLVLDVGCGTGYSSAVLGRLAEAVVALEEDPDLAQQATEILVEEACDNVAVVTGVLTQGLAAQGPYDLIFVNGMLDDVPQALLDQIAEGGRLVCVINDEGVGRAAYITCKHKIMGRRFLFDAAVPALPSFQREKKFTF